MLFALFRPFSPFVSIYFALFTPFRALFRPFHALFTPFFAQKRRRKGDFIHFKSRRLYLLVLLFMLFSFSLIFLKKSKTPPLPFFHFLEGQGGIVFIFYFSKVKSKKRKLTNICHFFKKDGKEPTSFFWRLSLLVLFIIFMFICLKMS